MIIIMIIIIFFFFFLHGLVRLICSGIDALPSFTGASTISSSSRLVSEGVIRESSVIHSFKMVDPSLFLVLTSCIQEISSSFLMISLLVLFSVVYPLKLIRKRNSAASRRLMSRVRGYPCFATMN
jgi:hypothetical protein